MGRRRFARALRDGRRRIRRPLHLRISSCKRAACRRRRFSFAIHRCLLRACRLSSRLHKAGSGRRRERRRRRALRHRIATITGGAGQHRTIGWRTGSSSRSRSSRRRSNSRRRLVSTAEAAQRLTIAWRHGSSSGSGLLSSGRYRPLSSGSAPSAIIAPPILTRGPPRRITAVRTVPPRSTITARAHAPVSPTAARSPPSVPGGGTMCRTSAGVLRAGGVVARTTTIRTRTSARELQGHLQNDCMSE